MVNVRIEEKPAFNVIGKKIWISGQDNEIFGEFWREAHENGYIDNLRAYRNNTPGEVTESIVLGISCVGKKPMNRAFYFYIAAEKEPVNSKPAVQETEEYTVPACRWAIFSCKGEQSASALIEAEMYAFM